MTQTAVPDETTYPIDGSYKPITIEEKIRFTKQERRVFNLLKDGQEIVNTEFAEISLKYFTKISSLRAKGFDIQLVREDHEHGLAWYRMPSAVPRLQQFFVPVRVNIPNVSPQQYLFTVYAVSAASARYRAWRAVKVVILAPPVDGRAARHRSSAPPLRIPAVRKSLRVPRR